jgi:hypothetical protein
MIERRRAALVAALAAVLALACAATPAAGEIHRWVDARGNVTYADRPPRPEEPGALVPTEPGGLPGSLALPPAAHATVDELIDLSGLRKQLAALPTMVLQEFLPRESALGPGEGALVRRIVERHFAPAVVVPLIRAELSRRRDAEKLARLVAWLRAPVGRRVTAEEVASTAADPQAVAGWVARLATEPPPPARVTLVERLQWIEGAGDTGLDLLLVVARELALAVQPALPAERRVKPGHIATQLAKTRERLLPEVRQAARQHMLYTYRRLGDEEVAAYVAVMASDAGRWFTATTHRALLDAVRVAAERASAEIVRAVPPASWGAVRQAESR